MNYHDYNAIMQGRARVRAVALGQRLMREVFSGNRYTGALFASAHVTRERRLEGFRLHKRGMVNEMPYHLYGAKCRRAQCAA